MPAIDPLLQLAHSVCSGKGVHAVLLGSGVSRAAGIPTGWEVTLDLVRRLAALEGGDAGARPDEWFRQAHDAEPCYSSLLGALARTPAERRTLLQPYFEATEEEREQGIKVPTAAHRAVARLVASGHVRVILTTNFDRLMERALLDEGVTPVVVASADQALGAAPLVHQRCVVIKLHGDYLDDRILNVEAELAAYDPGMLALLDRVLDEFGLIVSGWSGEWDPALRSAIERCRSRRYSTYWGLVGEPGATAAALIAQRQAQAVRTTGADALFVAVEEKVRALDDLRAERPESAAVAVATLKRCIVEDRFRVRLEDLVREEANRVGRAVDGAIPASKPPDAMTMSAGIRALDGEAETLRSLFFHGCRLGRPENDHVFLRSLPLLAPREEWLNISTWDTWRTLRTYPMSSVLYAGALGALLSERWGLLRRLLTLEFASCGRPRAAFSHLPAMFVLPEDAARAVAGNVHLPASTHFQKVLLPLASDLVQNPQALIDELEVWMCLAVADCYEPVPGGMPRIPVGLFMVRRLYAGSAAQPDALLAAAVRAGADWPPLREGWFGGDQAGFALARAHVEARVGRAAQSYF